MSTDQSYSGKESHATKSDLVGENSPQAVKNEDTSASEAPTPTPPSAQTGAAQFTFADLLLFSGLPDSDKALLSGLQANGFGNPQLVEAVRHMVQTSPDSSPTDTHAGRSLSDILSQPLPKKFVPHKLANLSATIDVLVNGRYGTSRSDVMLFALGEYRTHRLKLAFNDLAEGEYQNAYANFQDSEEAAFAILEIGLELGALADQNYWAACGEKPKEAKHDLEGRSRFEQFMRDYVGREATPQD